MFDLHKKYWTQ